jgi:hypothetical protein
LLILFVEKYDFIGGIEKIANLNCVLKMFPVFIELVISLLSIEKDI